MKKRTFYSILIVFFTLSFYFALEAAKADRKPKPVFMNPPATTKILSTVPSAFQDTEYSCGAASLQSVLSYYGLEVKEADLIKELGTTEEKGTETENIVEVAKKKGVKSYFKRNATIQDLADQIKKNNPVIVEFQAYRKPTDKAYPELWSEGHDAVVIGVDNKFIYLMDPAHMGTRGFIPLADFVQRWHDLDSQDKPAYQTAIFFEGTPNPPTGWEEVE